MNEKQQLQHALIRAAICGTDHPASAVTALMSAAASILTEQFGEDAASLLMASMASDARAKWAHIHAN